MRPIQQHDRVFSVTEKTIRRSRHSGRETKHHLSFRWLGVKGERTMHPRLLASLMLAASIGLSACATDEQLRNFSGDADYGGSLERPVVPNNGLCGAQTGAPMEHCDLRDPRVLGRDIGGIDWQGFPYNLPGG